MFVICIYKAFSRVSFRGSRSHVKILAFERFFFAVIRTLPIQRFCNRSPSLV